MKDSLIWFSYNVLFAIGYSLMMPKFLLRMWRRGGYRAGFMQRFGRYDAELLSKVQSCPRIWVHAVSVGEVFVALHFIESMRAVFPKYGFILTTTTSTGHTLAESKLGDDDVLLYFPADFPHIARRVVGLLNPVAVLLTEGEFWPNLLRSLNSKKIPVFVINGRISASSYRGYSKVRPFFLRAVKWVDHLFVQSAVDRDRFVALGATAETVEVMGSAKYDVAQPDPEGPAIARQILKDAGMNPDGPLLVGGSTWPGEESVLLDLFQKLRERDPALQFILVPRHMERRKEVEALLRERGLAYVTRTAMPAEVPSEPPCVLLADTTGELMHYYSMGSVVFVGKSLGDNHGGQNPIEPAMFGKPIVVGPHMENFPGVIHDFLEADALIQVADVSELEAQVELLLGDAETRDAYGARAGALVAAKRGVVSRTIETIRGQIEVRKSN